MNHRSSASVVHKIKQIPQAAASHIALCVSAQGRCCPQAGDKHRWAGSCLLAKEGVFPCRCEFSPQHKQQGQVPSEGGLWFGIMGLHSRFPACVCVFACGT